MGTDAEAFVSGECPTPSRQARCGHRRNAWKHATTRPTPSRQARCGIAAMRENARQHVRHRAARRGANIAAMRGNALHSPLTYMNDFQEEE